MIITFQMSLLWSPLVCHAHGSPGVVIMESMIVLCLWQYIRRDYCSQGVMTMAGCRDCGSPGVAIMAGHRIENEFWLCMTPPAGLEIESKAISPQQLTSSPILNCDTSSHRILINHSFFLSPSNENL